MSHPPRTIAAAAEALRRGTVTSEALTARALAISAEHDPQRGAYVVRTEDVAVAEARRADEDFARGIDRGPLQGIPFAVKDLIFTELAPTTAQSRVAPAQPSPPCDAEVVRRLRAGGAVFTGKTTLMEYAVGFPPPDGPFPMPRNPWALDRWPGGSSSGSASGVASDMFLLGVGTDTGGSLRVPAALCGVTGFKPTFGLVPLSGVVPFASALDHVGPIARTAHDCALALDVMAGHFPADPYSVDAPIPSVAASLAEPADLTGLRIGVVRDQHISTSTDPAVVGRFDDAVEALAKLGADLREVTIPHYDAVRVAAQALVVSQSLAHHLPNLQTRWHDFLPDTRAFLAWGSFVSGVDYVHAERVRRLGQHALSRVFERVDALVSPTVDAPAPTFDAIAENGPAALGTLMHTPYWNAVGNPALAVPMGTDPAGLPVSLHVAGRPFDDATVLRVGRAYQTVTTWHEASALPVGRSTS
jgi:aspartyl-tRNA(Asn)/glutamyl-tRNA(Gln) amidotransferase subunit A